MMRQKTSKYFIERFQLPEDSLYTWGRKPSGRLAENRAKRTGQAITRLEDGFLRSVGLPSKEPPLSLCVDDIGIYYDATTESRLEQFILDPLDPSAAERAERLQRLWIELRLSKYNQAPESTPPEEPFILLADQTKGDLSIRFGGASEIDFSVMLNRALDKWPNHLIVIKTHPEVASGKKKGHFTPEQLRLPRVRVCSDGGHPCNLLEHCDAVYTVTSQIGFEALLWNKPVFTFGMPFYAGWGLTQDTLSSPKRRQGHNPSLLQLIHASFVRYLIYADPETGSRTTPERVFTWIGLQRKQIYTFPNHLEAFGFTPWKARQLRRFIPRTGGQTLHFRSRNARPRQGTEAAILWGATQGRGINQSSIPIIRVEDGFIRSAGLGANLVDAQSWIFDQQGIYYAAERENSLESLLNSFQPTQAQIERAKRLKKELLKLGISKYNLQEQKWQPPEPSQGRERILVLGQVTDDASIRLGIPPEASVRTNSDLLRAARNRFKDAWIVYKPHPDVTAGMRRGDSDIEHQKMICDEWAAEVAIASLLEQVDRVCVLTSLGGFEALIRGIPVTTWGLPFYAGWGISDDILKEHSWINTRRHRQLDIDSLIYICLIKYPSYISRKSKRPTEVEAVIQELVEAAQAPVKPMNLEQLVFRWWGAAYSRVRHARCKASKA